MPIPPSDINTFDVRDDKVFYLTGPSQTIDGPLPGEKPVLHVYDLKERKDDKVVEGLSTYMLSADGKKVLYKVEKDYFIADAVADKGKRRRGQEEAGSVAHARPHRAHPGVGRDVQLGVAPGARPLLTARR